MKTKNFCHLRREVEDLQADYKLSRNTTLDLKDRVRELKHGQEADGCSLNLFKKENRKLIQEKISLGSTFDEVSVKYEGLKIKYDDLKGSYFSLKASYDDLKYDLGKMQGQLWDADGRLKKFEDRLMEKEKENVFQYNLANTVINTH